MKDERLKVLDNIRLNDCQTPFDELHLEQYPAEIQEQFLDFIQNVPFISNLISTDRPECADLPRDDKGRAIIDLCNPPIVHDMDYFRPSALYFKKHGCYSKLRPNPNKNSEFGKWFWEEVRRCKEGYVRPSDGMWITGYCYYFLNYTHILQTVVKKGSKRADRIVDFPEVWEGIIWRYHYIDQARNGGKYDEFGGLNGCEISRRGASKSLTMAAILDNIFLFGTPENDRENKVIAMAYQKQYLTVDGILNKFQSFLDFNIKNTEFPRQLLKRSLQDMHWISGYVDLDTNANEGSENECMGVAVKDDPEKARGKRVNFAVFEEFGSFPKIVNLYNIFQPSIKEGDYSFGQCYLIGTSGDDESDFQGAAEIVYNPKGYGMYGLPNVFDLEGQGRHVITFFFPGYVNRKGCYDADGNSDVTKAVLEILVHRYNVKYNSSDINSITKAIAEIPIVPQEALLRTRGNIFPVTELNERLNQLDNNPRSYADNLVGALVFNSDGSVSFTPTSDEPIRDFPLKDNRAKGAVEIFNLPAKDNEGKVYANRYIIGHDPVDDDFSETMSLTSTFVLDLWTDTLAAEYTGRQEYADDNFEIVRKLCIMYNAKCLYENNKKGLFAYFAKMNCTYLLADTPEHLKNKENLKYSYGNKIKGVNATASVNQHANELIKDWLRLPVPMQNENGEEVTIFNLFRIKSRALLRELVCFNPMINVDRVRALGMVMLYREAVMILYGGNVKEQQEELSSGLENDPFFMTYDLKKRGSKFSVF